MIKGRHRLFEQIWEENQQASTQTNKQTSKQTSTQTNKEASKQINNQSKYLIRQQTSLCLLYYTLYIYISPG